jgi:hypothetical protein
MRGCLAAIDVADAAKYKCGHITTAGTLRENRAQKHGRAAADKARLLDIGGMGGAHATRS